MERNVIFSGLVSILLPIFVAALPISSGAFAAGKPHITLCVGDWEGYSTADLKGGVYIDIVNEALAEKYELLWTRYSFPRCQSDFLAAKFDVMVGANKASIGSTKGTAPFDAAYLIAVYLAEKYPQWDEGKIISTAKFGWLRSYGFESLLQGKPSFTEVNSTVQGLRQLALGRFDVFLDDDIDVLTAALATPEFKGKGLKLEQTKVKEFMALVFRNTPETDNLVKISDEKITAMRKSGKLKDLFEKKYKLSFIE